jgi:DNA mismatch repair ATPase MutS
MHQQTLGLRVVPGHDVRDERAPAKRRRDAVRQWIENSRLLEEFRRELAEARDLERTLGRLSGGSGSARDLAALRGGLERIPKLREILSDVAQFGAPELAPALADALAPESGGKPPHSKDALLSELAGNLAEEPELIALIARAIRWAVLTSLV